MLDSSSVQIIINISSSSCFLDISTDIWWLLKPVTTNLHFFVNERTVFSIALCTGFLLFIALHTGHILIIVGFIRLYEEVVSLPAKEHMVQCIPELYVNSEIHAGEYKLHPFSLFFVCIFCFHFSCNFTLICDIFFCLLSRLFYSCKLWSIVFISNMNC